jgi:diacylglycerol kinase family enzyme
MRTLGLLVNVGNGYSGSKERKLRAFEAALRERGVETHIFRTATPGIAKPVLQAVGVRRCQALLAVGGDGTFNDLLQAAVATRSEVALGVVPFGSGNLLAQELGARGDIRQLAAAILAAAPSPVALGRMTAQSATGHAVRYFTVAAGVGADARVICGINPRFKQRFGIAAYYVESARQLLFDPEPLPEFYVAFNDSATGQGRCERVTQVVVERVSYFGRCLAGRNGHGLRSEGFRLVLFKTDRRSAFLAYGARLLASRFSPAARPLRDVEIAHAREITFTSANRSPSPVFVEVDGEPIGQLPASIEVVPDAVRILFPETPHEVSGIPRRLCARVPLTLLPTL